MKELSANQIIKKIISESETINPFNDHFDIKQFLDRVKDEVDKLSKEFTIENSDIIDVSGIIIKFNDIYEWLMTDVEELVESINLGKIELIEQVLALTNFDYFNALEVHENNLKSNDELIDLNNPTGNEIKNIFGDTVNLQDVVDIATDVCNDLIQIILELDPSHDKSLPALPFKEQNLLIRQLMLTVNLLVNIKTSFEFYRKEYAELSLSEDVIKIKHRPDIYYLLRVVGTQRSSNLTQESTVYAHKLSKKHWFPKYSIGDSTLYILNEGKLEDDFISDVSGSVCTTFYFHLNTLKFPKLDSIYIANIFDFLISLRKALHNIDGKSIISKAVHNQSIKDIPIKINKTRLVHFLQKDTQIKESVILKLLSYISQPLVSTTDIWKKPLIAYKDFYYVAFTPLAQGHLTYQIDNILEIILPIERQEKLFADLVVTELKHRISNNYKFENITQKCLDVLKLKDVLVFEMVSNIVVINISLFSYPLNSDDYKNILVKSGKRSIELNNQKEAIRKDIKKITNSEIKDIIGIILSNHTSLSGLNVEGNHLMDYHLLKNYLSTGMFQRGMVILDNGKLKSQPIADYKYFNNEDEFNKNIKNFCLYPIPIGETIKNYKIKENPIVPPDMNPQIMRDGIETISLETNVWKDVNELEYYLKQLFYFEKDLELRSEKEHIQTRLDYITPIVFNYISLSSKDRLARLEIVDIYKQVGLTGTSQLIYQFNKLLLELTQKRLIKDQESEDIVCDIKKAQEHITYLLEKNKLTKVSLSTIVLEHDLNEIEIENIIEYLKNQLSYFSTKYNTEEDLEQYLYSVTIFIGIAPDNAKHDQFISSMLLNFIDALNYNNHYQKARNFAEEILEYSFSRKKRPTLGWLCLFKCFIKQNNIFDAAYYGSLYVSSLIAQPDIQEYQAVNAFFNAMLLFRDFGFKEMADSIYNSLIPLNLSKYDQQKITLGYFNSKFLTSSFKSFIPEIERYLEENSGSILSFGHHGAFPWIAFMYNLKRMEEKGIINTMPFLDTLLPKFEKEIDPDTLRTLQASFFPIDQETKLIYRNVLLRVFETINVEDLVSEISKLEVIANNIIELSLSPIDFDNLLLAGLVINDNTLSFKAIETNPQAPFFKGENKELADKLSNYSSVVLANLTIKKGQLVCWLFNVRDDVYALSINSNKEMKLSNLKEWDVERMHKWLNGISDFYFNDKGDYPINMQEEDYKKILLDLNFANLTIEDDYDELLISTDLALAIFPHNLIQSKVKPGTNNIALHEDMIKELIENETTDFISFNKPITNIVSLEWFSENSKELVYDITKLTLEAWIPTIDEDIVIHIGYNKLKPVIDKHAGTIHTDVVSKAPLSSTINVFLAHGEKGVDGFRTVYTKHAEGSAIVKGKGVERLFGQGVIAVLFVCNSASISKQHYIQKLVSFTHEILLLGYKCVIAPAWNLNPDISEIWLESFITALKSGKTVSVSAHIANVDTAKKGYNEYHGFYSPTGWADMHVYGNPNIIFTSTE